MILVCQIYSLRHCLPEAAAAAVRLGKCLVVISSAFSPAGNDSEQLLITAAAAAANFGSCCHLSAWRFPQAAAAAAAGRTSGSSVIHHCDQPGIFSRQQRQRAIVDNSGSISSEFWELFAIYRRGVAPKQQQQQQQQQAEPAARASSIIFLILPYGRALPVLSVFCLSCVRNAYDASASFCLLCCCTEHRGALCRMIMLMLYCCIY